jgi:GT2 family glycosyltransferase
MPASLIICSRNRPSLLADTVASILEGDRVPEEIVIIDQSDVPHPELSLMDAVRYIHTTSRGSSRARNEGIAAARYDLLAFTDDDMHATRGWFAALMGALECAGPNTVLTGQVIQGPPESEGAFALSVKNDPAREIFEGRPGTDVLYTGNMALHRSAFEAVGLFDERLGAGTPLPAAEDNDFGFRLLEAGYRIMYVPEAALYHRAWRTPREYIPMRWAYARGQGAYLAKHLTLRDWYMLIRLAASSKNHLCGALVHLPRQPHRALGDLVYVAGLLSGATEWLLTYRGR